MNSNDISWKTINKYFNDNPNIIVNHHINSYNAFFSKGIKEIFKDRNPIRFFKEYDKNTDQYKYECELYLGGINADKIYYGKPIIYDNEDDGIEREHYMYPNIARLRNMTYGFTIHYDIDIKFRHPHGPSSHFFWPQFDDKCIIPMNHILKTIQAPTTTTGRQ